MSAVPTGVSRDGIGAQTMPRQAMTASNITGSGNLRLTAFTASRNMTSTAVRMATGAVAAAATPTLIRMGLYEVDSAGNGTLLASTPNDLTLFVAISTLYSKNWSVSPTIVVGNRYAVGLLIVSGAATPTMVGSAQLQVASVANENYQLPWWAALLAAQTDLPASFTYAALGSSFAPHYAALI